MNINFSQTDHLVWGRGSWSLCLSCICLLAMHTLICVTFSLLVSGLAAASACGSSWTFLFTFYAFRKRHSCETQLTTVINDWSKILDNGGQVDTFILDFEKAFDTPPHELLKSKLFCHGIRWEDTEIDIFFSVLQTTASCCKRRKIGLGPGCVCMVPHRALSLVPCCFLCTLIYLSIYLSIYLTHSLEYYVELSARVQD